MFKLKFLFSLSLLQMHLKYSPKVAAIKAAEKIPFSWIYGKVSIL